jgi:hypothetical protein
MSSRSIALQGVGYGVLSLALQGYALSIVLVDPPVLPRQAAYTPVYREQRVYEDLPYVVARVSLSSIKLGSLLSKVEARGGANLVLISGITSATVPKYLASGAANAAMLGVSTTSELGKILAKGKHDLTEAQILGLIMSLLAESE